MRFSPGGLLAVVLVIVAPTPHVHSADADTLCAAAKLQRAGKLHLCILTDAARVLRGRASRLAECEAKFTLGWTKAEAKANGACRTSGDEAALRAQVTAQALAVLAALNPPPPTTSTTLPPEVTCGGAEWPGCGGPCPAGSSCWARLTAGPTHSCTCLADTATPCAATGGPALEAPTCGGACPAGQVCATLDVTEMLDASCACIPAGSTPCLSADGPACGGACPAGMSCGSGIFFACGCQ